MKRLCLILATLCLAHYQLISSDVYLDNQNELQLEQVTSRASHRNKRPYVRPAEVDEETWKKLSPYFLPSNRLRLKLDRIFSNERVSLNQQTLKNAGFRRLCTGQWNKITVVKHPKLKGYLLKLITDETNDVSDWAYCLERIRGAQAIREAVTKYGYGSLFKVPRKWIYPLPAEPSPPLGYFRKNFLLVVEDMKILTQERNEALWQSSELTVEHLEAIYTIMNEVGLADIVAFNLPFTKKGKLVFIDTEKHHIWPVDFTLLRRFLSPEMQQYWDQLILNGGP